MQLSGLFPQLSDNMRKKITSLLTVKGSIRPKREKKDPRMATTRTFGVDTKERPLGQARRRAARSAGKAIRSK